MRELFNHNEEEYRELLTEVSGRGIYKMDRTGVGCYSLFGAQQKYHLDESFPLLTSKKVFWKGVVAELLWMISGGTNVKELQAQGVHIWDEWADENGNLKNVYGKQWRDFGGQLIEGAGYHVGVDQILEVQKSLRENPNSRRHVVSAWDANDIEDCALPPCHCLFQFHVREGYLDCQLYQRSADIFLGVPFNIASYSLLTMMMAQAVGLKPGVFTHTLGDVHLYANHTEQAQTQLERAPRPGPDVILNPDIKDIFDFTIDDIELTGYDPHPAIKADVAV